MLPSVLCETTEHSMPVLFYRTATSYMWLLMVWHGASLPQFIIIFHVNTWIRRFLSLRTYRASLLLFPVSLLRRGSRFLLRGLPAVGLSSTSEPAMHRQGPGPGRLTDSVMYRKGWLFSGDYVGRSSSVAGTLLSPQSQIPTEQRLKFFWRAKFF